ncbi:hypothetical protein ACGF12_00740 [Kitasatospora sp. NPDC048296]|uniref:hypothetical protein n=1 Tax=Kitasatospora sp. NPDC048296 TaxID=3364048 RepID=UPI00371E20AD
MAQPDCRLDIFLLLNDADFIVRSDTNTWSHHDGRPFTEAEQALADGATDLEFETLLSAYKIGFDHGLGDDPAHVLRILLYRYSLKLPDGATDEDTVAAMTGEDRAEYERLSRWARAGIRAEVVTLLLDANLSAFIDTKTWTHHDGRSFTEEERALARSCTRREIEAVLAQMQLELDFETELETDAPRAVDALLTKYYGHLPSGTLIRDPGAGMTEKDRTEYESLMCIIAPEPGEIFARGED